MSSTCESTEKTTSLEWVTFSEENHGDVCESVLGCSNEATHRVEFRVNCCHGTMVICWPCAVESARFYNGRWECKLCGFYPQGVTSIRPIGKSL